MDEMLGAVGSLIQAPFNFVAQLLTNRSNRKNVNKTNQANKDIAMMNNEYNEQMLQKQMDYNTEMWNKQNEYNSPQQQIKRLQQAGINPQFAIGQVASGQGASAPLPINTPTASPYSAESFLAESPRLSGMAEGLHEFVSQFMTPQADLYREQARGSEIENEFKSQMLIAKIKDLLSSSRDKNAKAMYTNTLTRLNNATFSDDVLTKNRQAEALRLDNINKSYQNQITLKDLQSYDDRLKSKLALESSQMLLNNANVNKSYQETKESLARTLQTNIRSYGYKIDNYKASRMADSMIKQEALRLTHMQYDSVNKAWEAIKSSNNTGPDNIFRSAWRLGRGINEATDKSRYKNLYGLPMPNIQ